MNSLIEPLQKRISILKTALKQAEQHQGKFPDGRLRVSSSGRQIRYYHISKDDDSRGDYLTKEKLPLATALAQKAYHALFVTEATSECLFLERVIKRLSRNNADLVYEELSACRKRLVTPYILTDQLYAKQWLSRPYKTSHYAEEGKIFDTNRGEKVRSKSEAILADMFYELGIPYRYEQALHMKGGGARYPDFTLLKVSTREEYYLEHFGLLSNEEYRAECLKKLNEYRRNGIYLGKNLLITYESNECPLDIRGTKDMIKNIFCD